MPEPQVWVIKFDDPDMADEVFTGAGAENAARARFGQISHRWSAVLLNNSVQPAQPNCHAKSAPPVPEAGKWRVGSKVPVNVYKGDVIVCQCQTPEFAAEIVAAMNQPAPQAGKCECPALDAAKAVWEDCLDRRGIKWECEKVSNEIVNAEILPAWAYLIRNACACDGLREQLAALEAGYARAESDVDRQSRARFAAEAERDQLRKDLDRIRESATDGRECPEWLSELLTDVAKHGSGEVQG